MFEMASFKERNIRMAVTQRIELPRGPEAARAARRHLDGWLDDQGCHNRDDALLAVSELVNNAVVHGDGDPIVVMTYIDDRIRLEVHDRKSIPPVRREPSAHRPGGYGLNIL